MKILYTATVASHICQFHLPYMQMLKEKGNQIHVAARNNLIMKNGLELKYCDKFIEIPFARSPKSLENLKALKKLKLLLNQENYDMILCNTPVGGVVTRLAARMTRKQGTKVVYIAHGFHFYHGAPKINWILFYPVERYMTKYCDILVTINQEDFELATERFRNVSVKRIHGVGVCDKRYYPITEKNNYVLLRQKEGIDQRDFVILCIGELNENKNQKVLIKAAGILKEKIPNLKVLLAGNGPKEKELQKQIVSENLEEIVYMLGYRSDLEKITPIVDLVVSCSRREGLGQNIIEAMLCKKPVVGAVNRGHVELIRNGENGYLFEAEDVDGLAEKIYSIYMNPLMAKKMGINGYERAQAYTVEAVKKEMKMILEGK